MIIGPILVRALARTGTALLTERVVINLVLVLAEWLVKRTANDLDDKLFRVFKESLGRSQGVPNVNLYDTVGGDSRK